MGLAQFSGRDTEDRRLQFIFRIYDMDRDGYISNGELFQVKVQNKTFKLTENSINHTYIQMGIKFHIGTFYPEHSLS